VRVSCTCWLSEEQLLDAGETLKTETEVFICAGRMGATPLAMKQCQSIGGALSKSVLERGPTTNLVAATALREH
jgi:hypothetical protein